MSLKCLVPGVVLILAIVPTSGAWGAAEWIGGGGSPTNIWTEPANWTPARVPDSATEVDSTPGAGDFANQAVMNRDGTTTLIDSSVDAVAYAVQIGAPVTGVNPIDQQSSNTLLMTGGTLTTQGGFLMNVGRGRNIFDGKLATFEMTGGVVNAAGITVPEAFNPADLPNPAASKGVNAQMLVSGDSVVNTDLLRLGAFDSNSLVVLTDNAQVNLTDDNNGFAGGVLWIEAFEATPVGTSLLDIRDNACLTIHGEWWTDENDDGMRGAATATELQYFRDNYIANGWIVANGGANAVNSWYADGVIYMCAAPEPGCFTLLGIATSFVIGYCRRRK